jgi:hypothetical protein
VPADNRSETIRAFRSASSAAQAFGSQLRHEGNPGYLKKSQELEQQMD